MKYRVLYNPLAGLGKEDNGFEQAKKLFEGKDAEFSDVTKEGALDELFKNLAKDDKIVLCGGDGTLNKFVNSIPFIPENEILYYPTGNGNDFYRDVAEGKEGTEPCAINPYIVNLPTVAVNGKTCKFFKQRRLRHRRLLLRNGRQTAPRGTGQKDFLYGHRHQRVALPL